ncbi:MAG: GatB/YqeY domain-containing protein [Ignavibacteria bacterium]|nr:GatB/YqeY domain-containing protein [Ignavibacteria bacterium]
MTLTENIVEQIKSAMKSGDKVRLETLRSLRAGILEFEKSGIGREMTSDDEFKILNSAAKKRKDSIEQFDAAGYTDRANTERTELAIIMEFLPAQMSEDDVRTAVKELAASIGATQQSDFGKLMGAATKALKGKADGSLIQSVAKQLLSGS